MLDQHDRDELNRFRRMLDQMPELGGPDPDEGARLHREKNAPWVSGQYSHLPPSVLHPPLVPREYPKMLFSPKYGEAQKAMQSAMRIAARGTEDAAREQAMKEAQYQLKQATRIVDDVDQERMLSGAFFETPGLAEEARVRDEEYIAQQAAESAWQDRNLMGAAKREREEYDANAEGHVVDVPAPRRGPGRPRKVTTDAE